MPKTILILAVLLIQGSVFASLQAASEKLANIPAPKISQPLPFKVGETLTYEVSFSRFIFSGTIGELKLSVDKASSGSKPELIELKAEAVSKGFFPKIFGLKVKDKFNSQINAADFGLHSSTRLIEEGKLHLEQKSTFDRERGRVTVIERNLAIQSTSPKIKDAASPSWIQDTLSACYFIRTQRLNEGDVIPVPISDNGQVYNIEIVVGRREEVKVDAGKFKAVILEAKVFDGRYVRRSGQMHVWVTDDSKRIPVRAKIKTSGATVTIDLKKLQQR